MARIGWFLLGALISLGLMHFMGPDREAAPPTTGSGTGPTPSLRWRGGPTARTPTVPDSRPPATTGADRVPAPGRRQTLKPRTTGEMIGRWNDSDALVSLELRADGTYLYAGLPGEWLDVTPPVGSDAARRWKQRLVGPGRPMEPGYAQPHAGTWRFDDDTLTLEPAQAIRASQVVFEWNTGERTVFVRFLGVPPGHLRGVTLERIAGP